MMNRELKLRKILEGVKKNGWMKEEDVKRYEKFLNEAAGSKLDKIKDKEYANI